MKQILFSGLVLILITLAGCGDDDNPTGPGSPQETTINITNITPVSPAALKFYQTASNDRVSITYSYSIVETDSARIWIQPFTWSAKDGSATAFYSPSSIYSGSGNRTVLVSATSSDNDTVRISQLEVLFRNPTTSDTIYRSLINVNYTFTK